VNNIIFSAWMGPGPMSTAREGALLSMINNNACLNVHINKSNLKYWTHPDFPLHPAFSYLSAVHQCDYLRCYLLHIYGGGYSDIKNTSIDWNPFFAQLFDTDAYGLGYTEIGPHGIAQVGGQLEIEMKINFHKIVGVCAMIFKPMTLFTTEWFNSLNVLLDNKYDSVVNYPAKHPQDRNGALFEDGTISNYPFAWTEVGGNLFHPIAFKYHNKILHGNISPSFLNYR